MLCSQAAQLFVPPAVVRVAFVVLQEEPGLVQLPFTGAAEFFVLRPEHNHVNIVIPGNEPLVPHRTQKRSAIQGIGHLMLPANPVQFDQHFQFNALELFQLFIGYLICFFHIKLSFSAWQALLCWD